MIDAEDGSESEPPSEPVAKSRSYLTDPDRSRHPPAGWNIAVVMLRTGIRDELAVGMLRSELGLTDDEAGDAIEFATEWLEAARAP